MQEQGLDDGSCADPWLTSKVRQALLMMELLFWPTSPAADHRSYGGVRLRVIRGGIVDVVGNIRKSAVSSHVRGFVGVSQVRLHGVQGSQRKRETRARNEREALQG